MESEDSLLFCPKFVFYKYLNNFGTSTMKTIFEQLSTSDSFYLDAKRAFIQGRESSDPELDFVKYSMETILALCLALAAASNKHNSYLGDHSNSVGNLAGRIAKEMGYSDFEAIGI